MLSHVTAYSVQEYKLRDYAEWDRLDVMQMEAYKIPGFLTEFDWSYDDDATPMEAPLYKVKYGALA